MAVSGGSFLWLASYPKSGNTWMRVFLATLRQGRELERLDDIGAGLTLVDLCREMDLRLGLSVGDLSDAQMLALRPGYLRILAGLQTTRVDCKVHDAYVRTPSGDWLFPPAVTDGAIYIVRDPRDVAVSYAHHSDQPIDFVVKQMAYVRPCRELSAWPERIPPQRRGWSEHVESWLDAPGLRRLVVRYEDMLAEPLVSFTRVADFAGLRCDPESVTAAIEATSFQRLREREEREGFREKVKGDFFFRQGRAGGWSEALAPAQASRIVADHGRVMRRLGYRTD